MNIETTHSRAISRDYGWPRRDLCLIVDLWVPKEQDVPGGWLNRIEYIPEFERRIAAQQGKPMRQPPKERQDMAYSDEAYSAAVDAVQEEFDERGLGDASLIVKVILDAAEECMPVRNVD